MNPSEQHLPEWFCVKAQTKREHIAANHLRELEGVEVFCPRLRYRKATRRGKIWWVEPLFPGYLLAKFCRYEMERAVTYSQGVRGLVRFGTEVPPIPESFVNALRQEVKSRSETDDETYSVTPTIEAGDEVEIAHGPLQGMKGTIVSVAPAHERIKVLLDFLGSEHPVDVDLFSILLPRRPVP
ncbi:MAG: transcription termination/antitermination protein NusG [Verrucomicrobiales bacterium]|nr:transcription termination/antitermination NusG family protein [Verrucomicrobiota bacterium JB025]